MRATMTLLIIVGSLGGCAYQQPREVNSTPPTVSYQVSGNDISQANAQADRYCQQYGMFANLQSLQPNGSQSLATYSCGGTRVGGAAAPPYYGNPAPNAATPYAAAPYYGNNAAPVATIRCADPMHQDLPGGTDYRGPPVYGCP
jgi:hypothetical protein